MGMADNDYVISRELLKRVYIKDPDNRELSTTSIKTINATGRDTRKTNTRSLCGQ